MTFTVIIFLLFFCLPVACIIALQPAASVERIAAMTGGAALLFVAALLLPSLSRRLLRRRARPLSPAEIARLDWPSDLTRGEMEVCCATWLRDKSWQVTPQQEPAGDAIGVYLIATRDGVRAAVLCDLAGEALNPAAIRAFALGASALNATHCVLLTLTRGRLPPPAETAAARAGVLLLRVAELPKLAALAPTMVPA